MSVLQEYSDLWPKKYTEEAVLVASRIPERLDIQHIGSTSIPGMLSKPIIDIGVLLPTALNAEAYIQVLESIGYTYYPESSSTERLFFRKGSPVEFHLSLAYKDRGSFWERQLLFRNYLRAHPEAIQEYIKIKLASLGVDPTGGKAYLVGKTHFVEGILSKASMGQ